MTTRNHWIHELAAQRGISTKTVEQTLHSAKTHGVADSTLDHVRAMRDESLRLFLAGETLAAMWAGQAMWEAAASVAYAIRDKEPLFRDYARQEGTQKPKNAPLQEAISKLVMRHPRLTAKELWQEASSEVTDQIGFERFRKRVTEARK